MGERTSAASVGLVLFLVTALALCIDWATPSSAPLRATFPWRVATGGALALYLLFQWGLSLCRVHSYHRLAKKLYAWHHVVGGLGPALLVLHSTRAGFGYLAVLSTSFLLNVGLGVVNHHNVPKLKSWRDTWVVSHIAFSIVVVSLGVYHAWTALWFE